MFLQDLWEKPTVAVGLALVFIAVFILRLFKRPTLPDRPIVGAKPGEWFPLQRARWRNTVDMKTATVAAYNYRDEACIFPIAGSQVLVHLPHKELQWLAERPDSDVNVLEQIIDMLQLDYTVMDPDLVHRPSHISLIAGILTRETGNLVPALLDEIEHSLAQFWGTDSDEFKSIGVYDSMTHVVGQVTNRAFVGLPFCRDPALLKSGIAFAQAIPVAATMLHLFPKFLRPILAPIITLPNRIHTNKFYALLRSEIEQRKARLERNEKPTSQGPGDFLQWSIEQAQSLPDPYFRKSSTLAGRVLIVNFTSIHTTSFAITHAILDLASAPASYTTELRAEITACLAAHGGKWGKRSLADMIKLDSVLRESQRVNSFATTAINRMVVNPAGITTPSGVHIPRGTMVCAPAYPVFHDEAIYSQAEEFLPFRFVPASAPAASENSEATPRMARQAFSTTSPAYTNFGHGKHACPGRFFASTTLKLMLAYMVLHYDFEMLPQRPENLWFAMNRIPPVTARLGIRRRKVAGGEEQIAASS
jgi:cytochrome P450